jgi:hypothetical protein
MVPTNFFCSFSISNDFSISANQLQKILFLLLHILLHIPYMSPHVVLIIPLLTLVATVLWIKTNSNPRGPAALHWEAQ